MVDIWRMSTRDFSFLAIYIDLFFIYCLKHIINLKRSRKK